MPRLTNGQTRELYEKAVLARAVDQLALSREREGRFQGYASIEGTELIHAAAELAAGPSSASFTSGALAACGSALGAKAKGDFLAVMCMLGAKECSSESFAHAMDFSLMHKLPVVFIVHSDKVIHSKKAAAHGMEAVSAGASDAPALYEAMRQAVAKARGGNGPTLVECTASEQQDPVLQLQKHMASVNLWDEGYEATVQKEAQRIAEETVEAFVK